MFRSSSQIHFTGIKGVGMTALALCAQDLGIKVSGSDVDGPFVTDAVLKHRHIPWRIGFSPDHLSPNVDLLIYTAAHQGSRNPQVQAAINRGIPVLHHAQALGQIMEDKIGISVCGVGGKTTTAAMLSHILDRLGAHPSFCIGVGDIPSLGAPGRYDKQGKYFIAEADEYTADPAKGFVPRFAYQHPQIIICTNIEFDHPDVYADLDHTKTVFVDFFNQLPPDGLLLINAESAANLSILPRLKVKYQTYLGQFNQANANAAIAAAVALGFDRTAATTALKDFAGTKRRFEKIGEAKNILLYDDYAHHPREIQTTLQAAKAKFPGHKLTAIFQPHTYSRTKALFADFARSFTAANEVLVLPIYASARETADPTVSSSQLVEAIAKTGHPSAHFVASVTDLVKYLKANLQSGQVIFTLGAGDIYLTHGLIIAALSA